MYAPFLPLISQASSVLRAYRTPCITFEFLSRSLGLVPIPFREDTGSQLFCSKLFSKTSPGSQTGGCRNSLTISVLAMLPAATRIASASSNLTIISRLNHFAFAPALSFPVLRLNLMLPLRLQGLGTGGWLSLTRWGFPTQFRQLTNACRVPSARKWKPVVPVSQLALSEHCTTFFTIDQSLHSSRSMIYFTKEYFDKPLLSGKTLRRRRFVKSAKGRNILTV